MTAAEKAYSVLSRTGGTRHIAASLSAEETAELADVYDVANDESLAPLVAEFWAQRGARLAALKATDDVQPEPAE